MSRKKWTVQDETPLLLKSREKRKWQVAIRRYVLEKNPCTYYAPYFGLDIATLRQWLELQFTNGLGWSSFASLWQIGHVVPINLFDFSDDADLKLCWNFINLRVESLVQEGYLNDTFNILGAKAYFQILADTGNIVSSEMLNKIAFIEKGITVYAQRQTVFLSANSGYISSLQKFTSAEFQQLNSGQTIEAIEQEQSFLKKFNK